MLLRVCIAFCLLSFSASSMADAVDVNLRDNSAQFQYFASMGHQSMGKSDMHAGVIYDDSKNMLGDLGLIVRNEMGDRSPGVSVGVGFKGLVARAADINVAAIALGGLIRVAPLADHRFGIIGQLYYAPNIVTFGKADRYIETGARIEYEIIPQAAAYVGYRKIMFGIENSSTDATMDEGGFVGVRIKF